MGVLIGTVQSSVFSEGRSPLVAAAQHSAQVHEAEVKYSHIPWIL